MAFAVRSSLFPLVYGNASVSLRRPGRRLPALLCKSSLRNNLSTSPSVDEQKLILEVKNKLEREYPMLPLGSYGRDDDEMILWFLKDRKFHIEETISKLTKAITWRREFGVSDLSEDAVSEIAKTGKAYVHEFPDVHGRPVLVVVASKHFPAKHDPLQSEKLCVFLIEKIINSLPAGKGEVLGIFDLRGFGPENGDILFLKFLIDVFYYYYPRRLGQVLFVDAPVVFQPIWQLVKPLLRSYANLQRWRRMGVDGFRDLIHSTEECKVLLVRHCPKGVLHRGNNTSELQRLNWCPVSIFLSRFSTGRDGGLLEERDQLLRHTSPSLVPKNC